MLFVIVKILKFIKTYFYKHKLKVFQGYPYINNFLPCFNCSLEWEVKITNTRSCMYLLSVSQRNKILKTDHLRFEFSTT